MLSFIKQNQIKDEILRERLDTVLPQVMKECGVEAWIVLSKEYNEDPMFHALTPTLFPTARRITILVLTQTERICVNMHDAVLEQYYTQDYDMKNETQMEALSRVLTRLNPKNIAIDVSDDFAFTDGLSVGLYRTMMKELPKEITDKFISSDDVGIRFLETRSDREKEIYSMVMDEAMQIIEDTFSKEQIKPGVTTCRDLMDYMAERVNQLGIETWFDPTIDLQRKGGMKGEDTVIMRGDLLHCDFGIRYMNLCTDTQRLCYVLKEDETELPEELKKAMKRNNRFQDIVIENLQIGRTGNEVFTASIEQGKKEGLRPVLYTHPLGFHGHGAGPTIGLFSNQNPIPVKGDRKVFDNTGYALELSIIENLEMFERDTFIFTEESILLDNGKVRFLAKNRDRIKTV